MTTFASARLGDRIELLELPLLLVREDWSGPLLLISSPASCETPGCDALRCEALASDGRWVPLHRLGSRPIDVLERWTGPTVRGGPALPADIEDDFERRKDEP